MKFRPGDRVRWRYLGKSGDTGVVLHVTPKRLHTGGSKYRVRVRWDTSKHEGSVEDRVLGLLHRPFKGCGCGRSYTREEWEQLGLLGHQESETERMRFRIELRNCHCGSTIGVEYRERKAS